MKYKIQVWDSDCECWCDADFEIDEPNRFDSRFEAENTIKHYKRKYCSFKAKVVEL